MFLRSSVVTCGSLGFFVGLYVKLSTCPSTIRTLANVSFLWRKRIVCPLPGSSLLVSAALALGLGVMSMLVLSAFVVLGGVSSSHGDEKIDQLSMELAT